jgi:8-oxo-dGTP diphosphatase
MNKIPPEEYYESLFKLPAATNTLFFDEEGRLLIVKPNYKEGWLVVGGMLDKGESPRECCIREVQEEIGISIEDPTFLGVAYNTKENGENTLQLMFYGGVLSDTDIERINLQKEELSEYRFVSLDEALILLRPGLRARVPIFLNAIQTNTVAYFEQRE